MKPLLICLSPQFISTQFNLLTPLSVVAQFVVVFLAVTRVKAIAAPLNAAYTEDEFKFYLEDAGSTLLLVPGLEGNKAAEAAATQLSLPIAGVHLEKGESGSGEVKLTPKAKLELAPELEVKKPHSIKVSVKDDSSFVLFVHSAR